MPRPELYTDELLARAAKIRLLLMDCDGVLTDGRIYFLPDGQGGRGAQGGRAGERGAEGQEAEDRRHADQDDRQGQDDLDDREAVRVVGRRSSHHRFQFSR